VAKACVVFSFVIRLCETCISKFIMSIRNRHCSNNQITYSTASWFEKNEDSKIKLLKDDSIFTIAF